jgi:hypothetical protein
MTRRAVAAAILVVALAVVAGGLVGRPGQVAVGCAVAVAAIAALLVVRGLADRTEARAAGGTAARDRTGLARLRALDRAVAAAVASPTAFDRELRPVVRSIARTRLARRGVDPDLSPAAAEAALGHELWEWIRGDASVPRSDRSPAEASAHLRAIVDRLERL